MSSTNEEQLSERLKLFRKRIGKSQAEMATSLGLSAKGYQNYESGERVMPAAKIDLATDLFGLNPQWLYDGEGEMLLPGPGVERERIWKRLMGSQVQMSQSAFSAEERKMMEAVIAALYLRMQRHNLKPDPAMFAKFCMLCYDLVMDSDDHNAEAAVEKMAEVMR